MKQDIDLLAMAPTGSGKTAVALIAILQAFKRGPAGRLHLADQSLVEPKVRRVLRVVPQEGHRCPRDVAHGRRQDRDAPPGSEKGINYLHVEKEILRNKLVKASGTQPECHHFAAAKAAAEAGDQEAATALAALIRDASREREIPTWSGSAASSPTRSTTSTTSTAARSGRRR